MIDSRTLCVCDHEARQHGRDGCCRAPVPRRHYGPPLCYCVSFTEAPFENQQLPLFSLSDPRRAPCVQSVSL